MIITLDGPAGAGKTTIAKMLSDDLQFILLKSGGFYRIIAMEIIKNSILTKNIESIIRLTQSLNITIEKDYFFLNSQKIKEEELYQSQINELTPSIAQIPEVRRTVNSLIHKACLNKDIIAEGRDMGSVVFPNAEVKFFITASIEARAKRRLEQGTGEKNLEETMKSIEKRDSADMNREEGALRQTEDAIYIDTSTLTLKGVYAKVLEIIKEKKSNICNEESSGGK